MSKQPPGEIVRSRREDLGLTREQLAAASSVSTSTIARLELSNKLPNVEALSRLSDVLRLPAASLLPGAVA